MAMTTSAEIRWFLEGSSSSKVAEWFSTSNFVLESETRDDHYLVFQSAAAVGGKFRDGKIEIKPLVKFLGDRTYLPGVAGRAQVWEKWSYGNEESKSLLMQLQKMLTKDTKEWITVTKERTLRKFSIDQGNPVEVEPKSRPHNGCIFELTKIMANRMRYWSIGFEAFSDPAKVEESLDKVVEHVFTHTNFPESDAPNTAFSVNCSHSYPEWLGRFNLYKATDE